jgi:spore coat protein U-like protein
MIKYKKIFRLLSSTLIFLFFFIISSHATSCYVASGNINFGEINSLKSTASKRAVGSITVICSDMKGDVNYSLTLANSGQLLSMAGENRGAIFYKLYTSANYSVSWNQIQPIKGVVKNINGSGKDIVSVYGEVISADITKAFPGTYRNVTNPPEIILVY